MDMFEREVLFILTSEYSWCNDLKYYLTHGSSPSHLDAWKRRALRLKYAQYQMINGVLFHQNYDNVLLRCLEKDDVDQVLTELYDGPTGIHFGRETTTHNVLKAGYYWPSLFKYEHVYAQKCQIFQVHVGRERRLAFPLQPVTVQNPFEQWGLDVVSEINPNFISIFLPLLTTFLDGLKQFLRN